MVKRTRQVNVRLSDNEFNDLEKKAELKGLSVPSYLRMKGLEGE